MRRKTIVIIGIICALLVGVACIVAAYVAPTNSGVTKRGLNMNSSLIDKDTLSSLKHESTSKITSSRLADGLTPPTNKWYSGMVLAEKPQAGFNVPNSILPRASGFELGLPAVTSTSDGIYGPHVDGITFTAADATSYKLTRYDELTATFTYYDDSLAPVFEVTFASGSPYAFISAKSDTSVSLEGGAIENEFKSLTTFKNANAWYGLKVSNGHTGADIPLKNGDTITLFSAPSRSSVGILANAADHSIVSGEAKYNVTNSGVTTILSYHTKDHKPTILVRMPHQSGSTASSLPKYATIYGELDTYKTNKIEYSQSPQQLKWSLPLSDISSANKASILAQLKIDIADSKLDKNDTYFGGKQLQRLAQLVMVADALGEDKLRSEALSKLVPAVSIWFDSNSERSFYYDQTAKAIVGDKASFGSDTELNDHHFHYGYFIYAASVAAKFDNDFLKKYKDDIDVLVADIANYNTGETLPLRRNFDAYAGHSWASGSANYSDGNNQESSGEAVNAWTAVSLWADVTNNGALGSEAAWLLANEISTARLYWLHKPNQTDYKSPLVSINWGGKHEYKTFFSNEPNAKLAIQLLPLNPTMRAYVSTLPESIYDGTDTTKPYGDYILMAKDGPQAYEVARNYPQSLIDDGNSKTYMMAYSLAK